MASLIDGCVFLPLFFLDGAMEGFGLPQWIIFFYFLFLW